MMMVTIWRMPLVCLAVVLLQSVAPGAAQQALRVAPDAQEIRAFRLSAAHLTALRHVADTLARGFKPAADRPRTDAAVFAVLSMSLAFNEPFSDRTIADTVRTIETGHADLH